MDEPRGTVFIVDDDAAVRESMALFMSSAGIPSRTFASAVDFLRAYDPDAPGCILLDVRMPGMSGIELQQRLDELGATLPVIFLTAFADVPTAVGALKAGAVDFLQKPVRPDELVERVRQALDVDARARARGAEDAEARTRLDHLTGREVQILRMVTDGMTNKAIARELGLSRRTVETHRANVMRKMGAHSLAELMRMVGDRLEPAGAGP